MYTLNRVNNGRLADANHLKSELKQITFEENKMVLLKGSMFSDFSYCVAERENDTSIQFSKYAFYNYAHNYVLRMRV